MSGEELRAAIHRTVCENSDHRTSTERVCWIAADAVAVSLRATCPTCHDPMAWHLTDTHPSGLIPGQWCYCEDCRAALAAPSTPEPSGHCRGCEADADLARRAHLDSPEPSDPDTAVTDAYKLGFRAGQRAAPPTEPALDVERLRQAIHEQCVRHWHEIAATDPDRLITQHIDDAHEKYATEIAAAYDRLAESR